MAWGKLLLYYTLGSDPALWPAGERREGELLTYDNVLYRALFTRPPPLPPASAVARFNPGVSRAADPPVSCLGPQEKSKPEFRM